MGDLSERMASLSKGEKRRLARHACMLCEAPLDGKCRSIFGPKCTDEQMLAKIDGCLAEYRPRAKEDTGNG